MKSRAILGLLFVLITRSDYYNLRQELFISDFNSPPTHKTVSNVVMPRILVPLLKKQGTVLIYRRNTMKAGLSTIRFL